jgi:Spy/CpxP family protein refolding chaperone
MTEAIESLGRVRMQGIALLLIAFLAGGVAGFAGGRITARRAPPRTGFAMHTTGNRPRGLPPFFDRLGLSPDQRTKITAILERERPRTDSILRTSLPALRAIAESAHAEIRDVLTPTQREQLDRQWGRRPFGGMNHGARGPMMGPGAPPPSDQP